MFDITILTESRYVNPTEKTDYYQNVLLEDALLQEALEAKNLSVSRTNWDDPTFDWSQTKSIIFRSTWDYFDRFDEFSAWLQIVEQKTKLLNSKQLIYWNIDKIYLSELKEAGVRIPPTVFIEQGSAETLNDLMLKSGWKEWVLKPLIAGAARHTYRFDETNYSEIALIYDQLIEKEAMMLQEFQRQIQTKGEIALIFFGAEFSHAILKKAKEGDFRVQDDFGGTVHDYKASEEEIAFALKAILECPELPIYARVDIIWNNDDELCLSELEMIEPELWFRRNKFAAEKLAYEIVNSLI